MTLWQLLEQLEIPVNSRRLILNAFVHASYVNEHDNFKSDNERLEFLKKDTSYTEKDTSYRKKDTSGQKVDKEKMLGECEVTPSGMTG